MSVLVCFHAHPDDEVFSTGGTIRLAANEGHRVVIVTATDGALGEHPDGILADGELLADRRRMELEKSTTLLGASRLELLHYADSGMAGTADNANPLAFSNIDLDVAAARLAEILREENADVLTIYDAHGGYGHPDHIRVYTVGIRAAEMAETPHLYEATTNRDHLMRLMKDNPQWEGESDPPDIESFGTSEEDITTVVDVNGVMDVKRAAMHAHETQVGDFGPFLKMPDEQLRAAFGTEWFRRHGAPAGLHETRLPL